MSLIDILAGSDAPPPDPKMIGVAVGRVVNTLDPLALGRVQVAMPVLGDVSPWARVATPAAGLASGFYWIPNVEDEVLVAFEQGDVNAPYVLGALWSAVQVPPLPTPAVGIRLIRTPAGDQIIFSDMPPSITIATAGGLQTITMSATGIQIVAGANTISLSAEGITIAGPEIKLTAAAQISLTAPQVSVTGMATTNLGSPGSPTLVKGLPVGINS